MFGALSAARRRGLCTAEAHPRRHTEWLLPWHSGPHPHVTEFRSFAGWCGPDPMLTFSHQQEEKKRLFSLLLHGFFFGLLNMLNACRLSQAFLALKILHIIQRWKKKKKKSSVQFLLSKPRSPMLSWAVLGETRRTFAAARLGWLVACAACTLPELVLLSMDRSSSLPSTPRGERSKRLVAKTPEHFVCDRHARVLVLYTGGTIGMSTGPNGKHSHVTHSPTPRNYSFTH